MRIAMINASPKLMIRKQDTSASYALLQDLKRLLRREHIHDFEDFHIKTGQLGEAVFQALLKCDVWVVSFPIYAGGLPSHLLSFMTELDQRLNALSPEERERAAALRAENRTAGKADESRFGDILVYAIGNGGLFEGNNAYPAFRMIALWSAACRLSWCGGLGVGGGPAHIGQHVSQIALGQRRSYNRRLGDFAEAIAAGIPTLNTSCSPDMSRQAFVLRRNRRYRAIARENGAIIAEISQRG